MQDIWTRIEVWLAGNAPAILHDLHSGATDQDILDTEAALGVAFPDDVRASFRLHNGQAADGVGFIDGWELLSLARVRDEWSVWKDLLDSGDFDDAHSEPEGPIVRDWWNAKWIPLTYSGSGDHHCLDLNPAPGGNIGQIIVMWHDDAARPLVAPNFKAWLETLAGDLEAGKYVFSEDYGGLVPPDDM